MAQTVVGFFDSAEEAREAVERLQAQGISRDSIDMTQNSGTGSSSYTSGSTRDKDDEDNGVTRFFKSLFGGDDDEADRYSKVGRSTTSMVTVHARSSEEAERAADILDECGAVNIDERASQYGSASGSQDMGTSRTNLTGSDSDRQRVGDDTTGRRETTIPRVEEHLEVGKRTEERGGVRVRSRIVERPVEEHIRLREEHVHVERQAVNRPLSDAEASRMQDSDIELTERAEVPVVNKEARVVEEVRISKNVEERDETIRDTVRNTEIDVDQIGNRDTTTGRSDITGDDVRNRDTDLDRDRNSGTDRSGL
jgi:stress response protein YsnF